MVFYSSKLAVYKSVHNHASLLKLEVGGGVAYVALLDSLWITVEKHIEYRRYELYMAYFYNAAAVFNKSLIQTQYQEWQGSDYFPCIFSIQFLSTGPVCSECWV